MPSATVESFQLAHLSDLHLATRANRRGIHHVTNWWSRLQAASQIVFSPGHHSLTGTYHDRAADALAERLRKGFHASGDSYDAIVITGDIATVGTIDDQAEARSFVYTRLLSNRSKAVVGSALVPGNHDRFQPPRNLPGSTEFEGPRAFGPCWRFQQSCGSSDFQKVQVFTLQKPQACLSLIAADFTLNSEDYSRFNIKHLSYGDAYPDRLCLLETTTSAEKNAGRAVIWLTHFAPRFPGRRTDLRKEQSLINAARQLDVPYILCGHTHSACEYPVGMTLNGQEIRVVCSGSSLAYGEALRSFTDIGVEITGNRVSSLIKRPYWHSAWRDKRTKAIHHVFSSVAPRPK